MSGKIAPGQKFETNIDLSKIKYELNMLDYYSIKCVNK